MTNGNRIPCEFLAAAEKDIVAEGKVVDRVSGVEYCQTEDGLVPCASIKSDGSTAFAYKLQQYTNAVILFLLQYGLYLTLGVGLLIGFVVARKKLAK